MATKKGRTTFVFTPLFCCCFLIRDKHPGSATLVFSSLADSHHANAIPDPVHFDADWSRRKPLSIHCHHCVV